MIQPISFVAVGDRVGDGVQLGRSVLVGNGVRVGRVVGDKVGEGITVSVGGSVAVGGSSTVGVWVSSIATCVSPTPRSAVSSPPPQKFKLQPFTNIIKIVIVIAVRGFILDLIIFLTNFTFQITVLRP